MAELGFAGLYVKLKDKSVCLDDKLQLLRYTWKSPDVFIPNKEQVLIDILCGYLIVKKKNVLSDAEVCKTWQCLCDVLHTKKAGQPNKQGQGLVVKQSISQLLTDALVSLEDNGSHGYRSSVIGCCLAIITSPTLSHVFTARLDLMVTMLESLCLLTRSNNSSSDEMKSDLELSPLIQQTVDRFITGQKTSPNQSQILQLMCEKLLPSFLAQWSESPSVEIQQISKAIMAIITHRDHRASYEVYLTAKHGMEDRKVHKKAKGVEKLFSTLATLLQSKSELSNQTCLYLPVLFDSFIVNDSHNSSLQQSHFLLLEICDMIGLNLSSSALCGTLAPSTVLRGVNQLLLVVQKHDLYSVILDEKNGSNHIKFYRHVVKVLLQCKHLTLDWYSCLTTLLQLNHHILETSLTDIFSLGWVTACKHESETIVAAMDTFLQELVVTYEKLRQFPKFITRLLETLTNCQGNRLPIVLTPKFLKSYGEVIQSLPQGTTIDVWKMFLKALTPYCDQTENRDTGHFQGTCTLFHHYLLNVKVTDYSVTDLTSKAVHDLMVTTETEVLLPLILGQIKVKETNMSQLLSTLHMCHAWGEVMAMLALYTKYRASQLQERTLVSHAGKLSYLHSYLDKEQWRNVYKKIQKSGDASLLYAWDVLSVQTARTSLAFKDKTIWPCIGNTIATILTFPEVVAKEMDVDWSGQLLDVTKDNITVARWHLLTTNMAAIHCVLSEDHLQTIANFIVMIIAKGSNSEKTSDISLYTSCTDLISSDNVRQSSGLLSYIVTEVWQSCKVCFTSNIPSNKKRKSSAGVTAIDDVMSTLGDKDVKWKHKINSTSLEKIQEAAQSLKCLFESDLELKYDLDSTRIIGCIQILSRLPLAQISSCDQMRCLIGLLSIQAVVNKNDKSTDMAEIKCRCVELCCVVLDSCGTAPVFQVIDISTYLYWLQTLPVIYLQNGVLYKKLLLYIELSCVCMMKDYKVFNTLPLYIDKLCVLLEDIDKPEEKHTGILVLAMCFMKEFSKLLSRVYVNDSLETIATAMYLQLGSQLLQFSPFVGSHMTGHMANISATLVQCYSSVLAAHFHSDETLKHQFCDSFEHIIKWCENMLEKGEENQDIFTTMSALNFLYTISRSHVVLDTVYTPEKKVAIWTILLVELKKLLELQKIPHLQLIGCSTDQSGHGLQTNKSVMDTHTESATTIKKESIVEEKTRSHSDTSRESKSAVEIKIDSFSTQETEQILTPAMLASLYKSYVFKGTLEGERSKFILMQVQTVMAEVVASCDLDPFTKVIQGLIDDVSCVNVQTDRHTIQSSLHVWRHLLRLEFSEEQTLVIQEAAQSLMLRFQNISQQLSHYGNEEVVMEITVPILYTQHQMLSLGPKFLPSQTSVLCLHSCIYAPLEGSTYIPVFHAVLNVLNVLLLKHADTVFQNIPAYIGCAKRLLLSVVEESNQETVSQQTTKIKQLIGCAHQMERLFTLIGSHKQEFSKVALYVVSDYVTAVQKVTLYPAIKRALVPAIYKMLDLCDVHAVSQLHTVLSYGVTAVFKILYNEYTKFHKYSGKV